MKIYNLNFRFFMFILIPIAILIFLFCIAFYLINSSTIVMNNENYTSILKECHDDPYKFVGKKIIMDGYIFRNEKFKSTQFVTARDMLVGNNESRIVGFLCEYNNASNFENNSWVHVVRNYNCRRLFRCNANNKCRFYKKNYYTKRYFCITVRHSNLNL